VSDKKDKPVLDEQTFGKLLEAAYVLQEHNREIRELGESLELLSEHLREQEPASPIPLKRAPEPAEPARANGDYTLTLAEIVEAQRQIQRHHFELDQAMAVVAESVARITSGSGAAVGILEGRTIRYRAGAGAPALPLGSEAPLQTAICSGCVRTGQVIRTEDVNLEFLFDPEPCRQRGIQSLIAVPVYHDGSIVGALELYFAKIHGFAEQDIHTCQLMAGLVSEAIGRDAESALKKSMAAERSSMRAAIEKLKPNPATLGGDQSSGATSRHAGTASTSTAVENSVCWKCGVQPLAAEQFCEKCGAPRAGSSEQAIMQSNLPSAWHMQQSSAGILAPPPSGGAPLETPGFADARNDVAASGPQESEHALLGRLFLPEFDEEKTLLSQPAAASMDEDAIEAPSIASQLDQDDVKVSATALVKPKPKDITWSSAAKARDFLETLAETRTPSGLARFWRSRRGDFYLAVAVILVAAVIRWGILSNHSVGATGHGAALSGVNRRKAPDADLSTFDKLLIDLGLAEAPEAPEYKGNPDTQVWVDLHTALYYCPGSDLYGKTLNGKFATQRDAQLDQFEPSSRKACD